MPSPRAIPMPRTDTTMVGLRGGLDLISPPPLARPGTIREGQNFEVIEDFTGGYRRVDGYDQFDGRSLPHNTTVTHLRIALEGTAVANDVAKNPSLFSSLANKGITLQDSATPTPTIYGEMISAEECEGNSIVVPRQTEWQVVAIGTVIFGESVGHTSGFIWHGVHAVEPDLPSPIQGPTGLNYIYYNDGSGSVTAGLYFPVDGIGWSRTNANNIENHAWLGAFETLPSEGDPITVETVMTTVDVGKCGVHDGQLKVLVLTESGGTFGGNQLNACVSLIDVNGDFVAYPNKEDADPTYIYLLDTVNPLVVGERIGVVSGTADITAAEERQSVCAAANRIRAIRDGVPGSGPIRGVVQLGDDVFAFRDNTAGDAQKLYKAGTSGWAEVDLRYIFTFDSGNGALIPEDTDIAYGAGRSVIRRIVTYTGSWADGDARGLMLIDTPSVAFPGTTGEVTVTHSGSTTTTFNIHNNVRANTLNPGGKWQFIVENFKGQEETERIYGVCAGTNHIIEFDGSKLVPIETSLTYTGDGSTRNASATNDRPTNIVEYQNHLFYSVGSSIFCSGPGEPYQWSALDGGVEFAMGHTVTGMMPQSGLDAGAALAIFTKQKIVMLHGTGQVTFETSLVQANLGAIQDTVQQLERTYFMNNLGLFDLESAFRYSKYQQASHSYVVWPFLRDRLKSVIGCVVNRTKNQYRIFFSDGTALYGTFVNGKPAGYMTQVFPHRFHVVWNGIDDGGDEVTYAGDSTTGDVYKFDSGNTFNGENIDAFIRLNWDTSKMPRTLKTYRRATLHLQGNNYVEFTFGYRLSYEKSDELQPGLPEEIHAGEEPPRWDSFTWDVDSWDGGQVEPTELQLEGSGESISFEIGSDSDCSGPFDVKSLSYDYTARRKQRG